MGRGDALAEDQQRLAQVWTQVESAALEVLSLRRGEQPAAIDQRAKAILSDLYFLLSSSGESGLGQHRCLP